MPQSNTLRLVILGAPLDSQSAGIHFYTKGLLDQLHQQEDLPFDVILFRLKKSTEFPKFKTISLPIITWIPFYASIRLFFLLPFYCRKYKADIVMEPAHFGPFNLPDKVKRVTVIHDLTPILFPQWHTFQGWFLQKLYLKRICRQADLILTVSENTRKDIIQHFDIKGENIKRIYPGIADLYHPVQQQEVLDHYNIGRPYWLTVGTIEPRKNHLLILKAFEQYKTHSNAEDLLVIAGGVGWKYQQIMEALEKHPFRKDIVLTGYVPLEHLPALYSHCIAMIYASHYEGFGLPVVEAAACGARCLVADNSSLTELANPLISYYTEPAELTQLMLTIDSPVTVEERKKLTDSLRERFSWQKHVDEFIDVVKNLARSAR